MDHCMTDFDPRREAIEYDTTDPGFQCLNQGAVLDKFTFVTVDSCSKLTRHSASGLTIHRDRFTLHDDSDRSKHLLQYLGLLVQALSGDSVNAWLGPVVFTRSAGNLFNTVDCIEFGNTSLVRVENSGVEHNTGRQISDPCADLLQ